MGKQINQNIIINRLKLKKKRQRLLPPNRSYVIKNYTVVIIKQTLNNIFININEAQFTLKPKRKTKIDLITYKIKSGKLLFTSTCGMAGFKGPRRPTHYAAEILGRLTAKKLKSLKIRQIVLLYKSPVTNKITSFLTGLCSRFHYRIPFMLERIPLGHNGIRKQKTRRM
jgi:ribosomal protein S11